MYYALRIDDCFEDVQSFLERVGYGGFAVKELGDNGDNPHWHFLLEVADAIKIQAVRTALGRAVPALKGNGKYSLTVVKDVAKYERYLCKGESDGSGVAAAWRNSIVYSDEKLEELHEAYWAENRKLKKRKAGSVVDHVIDVAKREGVSWEKREELAKIYIRQLGEQGKPINCFSIRSNLNAVQLALCPGDECLAELVQCVVQH